MKNPAFRNFLFFTLLSPTAALFACDSPLLNHSNAEDRLRVPQFATDANCPLTFPMHGLCASWTWDRMPKDSDPGTALIRFWKKGSGTEAGPYVTPGMDVFVKLWMPRMGHGSSPVTTRAKVDAGGGPIPGVFEAMNVFFVMPGTWEIWIQLKHGADVHEQAKLDVEI